jgi:hypothetical protein
MKNIAKLTLFFSLSFIILLTAGILLRLLSTWVDLARIVPVVLIQGEDAAQAARNAFPAAIYLSVLLTLSYTARRKMSIPVATICIWVLGAAFIAGSSMGTSRIGALKPTVRSLSSLQGKPGLILTRRDNTMILLRESTVLRGPRVVSIPGQPLIYQQVPLGPNNTTISLPALPFTEDIPWFIQSLGIDFSLCAKELESRLNKDFTSFAAYALSLILLLGSLRFVMELSQWPLANLFLGALVFRLILAFEVFLNSRQINNMIVLFLKNRLLPAMVTPLVFCAISVLVIFYTFMANIAKSRRDDD